MKLVVLGTELLRSVVLHCLDDRLFLQKLLFQVRNFTSVSLSLQLELLLGAQSSCLSILQLDFELNSLEVAVLGATLDIGQFIPQVIDDFLLLRNLDAQFLLLRRHELRIVLHLRVCQGFSLSIPCLFVPHQLLKEGLKLADHLLLLFNGVFVQSGLFVFFGQGTQLQRLLLECHLQVVMLSLDSLRLSKVNIR